MSQKLTYEQLRRGAEMDLGECLRMEMRMVSHAATKSGPSAAVHHVALQTSLNRCSSCGREHVWRCPSHHMLRSFTLRPFTLWSFTLRPFTLWSFTLRSFTLLKKTWLPNGRPRASAGT